MGLCIRLPLFLLTLLAVTPSALAHTRLQEDRQSTQPSLPFQLPQYRSPTSGGLGYVTRLRNRVIEAIWGASPSRKSSASKNCQLGKNRRKDASLLSPNILARYGEDVVLRFNITSEEEARALADAVNILFLDVWEYAASWADIRLSKDVVPSLLGLLPASMQTSHTPLMHSLAQTIYESYPFPQQPSTSPLSHAPSFHPLSPQSDPPSTPNIFFQTYQPLSVITPWLSLLSSLFTTHVSLLSLGLSYEGRSISALRVGVHPTDIQHPLGPRKTIIISGGTHAREWISTSTVNYVAYSLITAYGKSKSVTQLIEDFDWVFIPTLNPDGYTYTWETDRLWRKNRQQTNLRFCQGLDLDRAFEFEWSGEDTASNPCSESFSGEQPFEGIEALRFANWVKNETMNNVEIVAFLDLHSYSQQVLYPYSFSCLETPPNLEDLEEVAMGLAKAMRVKSGVGYGVTAACEGSVSTKSPRRGLVSGYGGSTAAASAVGQVSSSIWPRIERSGGSALDWMYHEMQVKHAYQIKLRDTGSYGFLLPAEDIVPTGKEVWSAVKWLGSYLNGNKGIEMMDRSLERVISQTALDDPISNGQAVLGPAHSSESVDELQDGEVDYE